MMSANYLDKQKKWKEKSASSKKYSVEMVEKEKKKKFMDAHMILPSLAPSLHQPQHDSTDLDVLRKWIDGNASAAERTM